MTGGMRDRGRHRRNNDDLERKGRGNRRDRDKERKWIEKDIKTITNEGAVSSIENEGTIGGSGNYGIDNAGDIGQINDGGSSSLEGTIDRD